MILGDGVILEGQLGVPTMYAFHTFHLKNNDSFWRGHAAPLHPVSTSLHSSSAEGHELPTDITVTTRVYGMDI